MSSTGVFVFEWAVVQTSILDYCGEEGARYEGKTLSFSLTADLQSNPHLVVMSNRKSEITDTKN